MRTQDGNANVRKRMRTECKKL